MKIEEIDFSIFEDMTNDQMLDHILNKTNKHNDIIKISTILYELGITKCSICGDNGYWDRQNTVYADDKNNWICACEKCHNENNENWNILWQEVNAW